MLVLNECETWSHILREENRSRVFKNKKVDELGVA
jgi:hypothetical protein